MEMWKDVEGYEGLYQISNQGRVKSLARMRTTWNWGKELQMPIQERILKPSLRVGYPFVVLCKNGTRKNLHIHRLVGLAFIPKDSNKNIINHKNGIKTDATVENLEWCTQKENRYHARKTGLESAYGSGNGHSKLNESQVLQIKKDLSKGTKTHKEIAKEYNVDRSLITLIKANKAWRHV